MKKTITWPESVGFCVTLFLFFGIGCSEKKKEPIQDKDSGAHVKVSKKNSKRMPPVPEDEKLKHGYDIWIENCRDCHLTGLAGAPKLADKEAWKPRIAKGMEVLFNHAIEGFQGPTGNEMEARGGNPDLTDEEVKAAVSYVVHYSQ